MDGSASTGEHGAFDHEVGEFDRARPVLHDEAALRERYGCPNLVDDQAPERSSSGQILDEGYRDLHYDRLLEHARVLFRLRGERVESVIYVPWART